MLAIPWGTCALWRRLHHTLKRKAVFLCCDQGVCARTSLHTCACVHACVSVRLSRSEKKLEFHSSSIIHVLSFILLSFATRFFTGLQLVQARLAGRRILGIHLPLPLYLPSAGIANAHHRAQLFKKVGSENQTQVLLLEKQAFYWLSFLLCLCLNA